MEQLISFVAALARLVWKKQALNNTSEWEDAVRNGVTGIETRSEPSDARKEYLRSERKKRILQPEERLELSGETDKYAYHRADRDFIRESLEAERIYLNIPYSDRAEAKRLGFRWDSEHKKWWGYESHCSEWPVNSKEAALINKWLN